MLKESPSLRAFASSIMIWPKNLAMSIHNAFNSLSTDDGTSYILFTMLVTDQILI